MKLRALVVGMGLLCSFSSFAATELRYGLEAEYPPFESRNASGELEGSGGEKVRRHKLGDEHHRTASQKH